MPSLIRIGGDHAGFELKAQVIQHFSALGWQFQDFGPGSAASVDYPDHVHPLCQSMAGQPDALGILICGSGNGVCMTANKYPYIRAALVWNQELAALARQHNNANILCLPARFISAEVALACVHTFLTTAFEGGRHAARVDKIACK